MKLLVFLSMVLVTALFTGTAQANLVCVEITPTYLSCSNEADVTIEGRIDAGNGVTVIVPDVPDPDPSPDPGPGPDKSSKNNKGHGNGDEGDTRGKDGTDADNPGKGGGKGKGKGKQ